MIVNSRTLEMQALIAMLYLSGARVSEILRLTPADVNVFESEIMIFMPTLKKRDIVKRPIFFKRDAPFLDYFVKFFEERKEQSSLFWITRQRSNYYIKKVNTMISAHAFRHNRAQRFADGGAPSSQIKAWMGWSGWTTAEHYIDNSRQLTEPLKEMIT